MRGSFSSSALGPSDQRGEATGLEIWSFLSAELDFRGDMMELMMLEERDEDLVGFLESSVVSMLEGLRLSVFLGGEGGEFMRCGADWGTGPADCNFDGSGSSATDMPAALAASCSMTCAYISSRSLCRFCWSLSTTRVSTFGFVWEAGVCGEYGDEGERGDVVLPGKT